MAITVQRRKRYLWPSLLLIIATACVVALLYVSQVYKGPSQTKVVASDAVQSDKLIGEECSSPCITKECISFSNMLIANMNPDADPCENFYSYACGNYGKEFGKDEAAGIGEENKKIMITVLKDILNRVDANPGTASGKMKTVYESCLKTDSDTQAIPYAIQFLSDVGIGPDWPNLSEDFKFKDSNLTTMLGKLVYFEFPFIRFQSETLNEVLGIPYHFFILDPRKENEREKIIEDILGGFDINRETIDQIKNDYSTIRQLLRNMLKESDMHGFSREFIQLDCLNNLRKEEVYICQIFDTYIEEFNMSSKVDKSNINVSPILLQFITELMLYSDRYIANYVAINFFWSHMEDLGFPFQLKQWKLTEQIKPFPHVVPPKTREDYCVGWIAEYMFIPLGYEFVQEVFPNEAFNEINRVVEESGAEVADFIRKQKWLPNNSREQIAQIFENSMSSLNFLPNVLFNEMIINDFYEEFHPDEDDFLKNVLHARTQFWKIMTKLGMMGETGFTDHTFFEVQAYQGHGDGVQILGLGMFFGPLYSFGRPRLVNLMTLSSVIAHELGHTLMAIIEQMISREDLNSTIRNDYANRTSCLEEQYSQFEYLDGVKLDGSKYSFEAYADVVSVQVLDKLIEKYAWSGFSLFGSPYSTEQLSYVLAAQMYCSKTSLQYDDWRRRTDEHPPDRYRVIGKMQSSERFSRAFNCTEGSYMNPAVKCLALDPM